MTLLTDVGACHRHRVLRRHTCCSGTPNTARIYRHEIVWDCIPPYSQCKRRDTRPQMRIWRLYLAYFAFLLLFSGHSTPDASDTSARAAPGVHVAQPSPKPKGRIESSWSKVSHEARRSSDECVGSHVPHRPNYESSRFVMV